MKLLSEISAADRSSRPHRRDVFQALTPYFFPLTFGNGWPSNGIGQPLLQPRNYPRASSVW